MSKINMNHSAADWINLLRLQKHVEGGWYSEVYRSQIAYTADRSICTHIYFLLGKNDFSTLHRIKSDELWHFYAGDELIVYEFDESGKLNEHHLSGAGKNGAMPFCVIGSGNWFGARLKDGGEYALVGCSVSPGFDFEDLDLGKAEELSKMFVGNEGLIRSLCRI